MAFLVKCKDVAAANIATLEKAGLFKLDNIKAFTMELSFPFTMFMENKSVAYVQSIVLAQTMDLPVRRFAPFIPSVHCLLCRHAVLASSAGFRCGQAIVVKRLLRRFGYAPSRL